MTKFPKALLILATVTLMFAGISPSIIFSHQEQQANKAIQNESLSKVIIERTDIDFTVEVAKTPEERAQGLMFRESMPENRGMIFLFEEERELSFWMKNTHIPLDIIFINSDFEIVKIHKNTIPFQTNPSYRSEKPSQYVLEINGGLSDQLGILEGDKIIFQQNVQ